MKKCINSKTIHNRIMADQNISVFATIFLITITPRLHACKRVCKTERGRERKKERERETWGLSMAALFKSFPFPFLPNCFHFMASAPNSISSGGDSFAYFCLSFLFVLLVWNVFVITVFSKETSSSSFAALALFKLGVLIVLSCQQTCSNLKKTWSRHISSKQEVANAGFSWSKNNSRRKAAITVA